MPSKSKKTRKPFIKYPKTSSEDMKAPTRKKSIIQKEAAKDAKKAKSKKKVYKKDSSGRLRTETEKDKESIALSKQGKKGTGPRNPKK